MKCRKSLGFTLTETAVVLGVSSILTATAVPALQGVHATRQVRDEAAMLADALRLGRSEALRRDELVTVCALAPSQGGEPTCRSGTTGNADWSAGFMVFVDRGQRGEFEDDDLRIQVQQWAGTRVSVNGTWPMVTYRGTGVQFALSSRFDLKATGAKPMVICVAKPGRARVAEGTAC